ncbi:hypothetical protein D910_11185 [Dendroctonus ponderosae]|uniref:Uncharacterized protein n=1 Tax=Dendroctonus ponderosae TaxID=77166 RepID=U4UIQ1_DENPD|nr:hypothetical protein D910_11185 [Dendroctonus ponderosae]
MDRLPGPRPASRRDRSCSSAKQDPEDSSKGSLLCQKHHTVARPNDRRPAGPHQELNVKVPEWGSAKQESHC